MRRARGWLPRPRTPAGWLWLAARVAAGGVAATRIARAARRRPPVVPEHQVDPSLSISVVVPARDEAARLPALLVALAADPAIGEVVVVDDQSNDDTAAVAAAHGARVVAGEPLPPGWAGKAWALQQGIDAASGEWVVALDADTVPDVGLATALVHCAVDEGWDLLSVAGRFAVPTPGFAALHPSMLATLVYRFGPPGAAHRPLPPRVLVNGQCLVFRRQALRGVGGFSLVKGSLEEDVALARALAAEHWQVAFLDGTEALLVRAYDDGAAAWRGWGRSLALVDATPDRRRLAGDLVVVWLAQALPLTRLVLGRGDVIDLVLGALRLGTAAGTHAAYERPGAPYWLSPLLDLPVAVRLTQSVLRPERAWRGRTYDTPH